MKFNTQRDVFISELQKIAEIDKDVIFISVDMGAPALDSWRENLPKQFFATGISEQHSINLAAGFSAEGKKVYVYFMGCWAARCFEQLKYSCAFAKNPITLIGNTVGYGYAPAGPAHAATEDIGYMRTLNNIEIYSPLNLNILKSLVDLTYQSKLFRHIRFERTVSDKLIPYYNDYTAENLNNGFEFLIKNDNKICIVSSGYMMERALTIANNFAEKGIGIDVCDLYRIKPLNASLKEHFGRYSYLVTLEEQNLHGCFSSAICEFVCDNQINIKIKRFGLPERYFIENGSREVLFNKNGLSIESVSQEILKFIG